MIDKYFTGTASRIEGVDLDVIAREALARHRAGFGRRDAGALDLDFGGEYQYRLDGEKHLWNPDTDHQAAACGAAERSADSTPSIAKAVNDQSRELMHAPRLFEFVPGEPVPLEEVEPASEIVKRFYTGAMSHGSISKEAHETLAIAMNRLGGNVQHGRRRRGPASATSRCPTATRSTAASSRWPAAASA